jgi:hypothetical protein
MTELARVCEEQQNGLIKTELPVSHRPYIDYAFCDRKTETCASKA